ncbi:Uncharacterized protein Adt_26785 [Abeliophyllum distichum]|uniref:Uncharacterized protein n=1 Tax=Abeliophyllum distichum TaxID=126358 RepID=A0ABD1RRW2_9LAMI
MSPKTLNSSTGGVDNLRRYHHQCLNSGIKDSSLESKPSMACACGANSNHQSTTTTYALYSIKLDVTNFVILEQQVSAARVGLDLDGFTEVASHHQSSSLGEYQHP